MHVSTYVPYIHTQGEYCVETLAPLLTTSSLPLAIFGTADIVLSLTAVYVVYSQTEKQGYRVGAWFCATLGIS